MTNQPNSKSRASVIFFPYDMVEEGVLDYDERSEKGGYHRGYYPTMSRVQLEIYVVETIITKLKEVYPSIKGI